MHNTTHELELDELLLPLLFELLLRLLLELLELLLLFAGDGEALAAALASTISTTLRALHLLAAFALGLARRFLAIPCSARIPSSSVWALCSTRIISNCASEGISSGVGHHRLCILREENSSPFKAQNLSTRTVRPKSAGWNRNVVQHMDLLPFLWKMMWLRRGQSA